VNALESPSIVGIVSVAARVLLASVFVYSAVSKTFNFGSAVAEVQGLGVPVPAVVTMLVIVTQALGAALLLVDGTAWLGAAMLALFTLDATVLAHPFWNASGVAFSRELTTFLEHLGLVSGLVLAAIVTQSGTGS
jgi:transmembrane protein